MKNRRRFDTTRKRISVVGAIFLLGLILTGSVDADVACGDTITTDTVLTNDLVLCPRFPNRWAIRVKGAVLDMNGHRIVCSNRKRQKGYERRPKFEDGPLFGVLLIGKKSMVKNGFVENCEIGVELLGSEHIVRNMDLFYNLTSIAVRAKESVVEGNRINTEQNRDKPDYRNFGYLGILLSSSAKDNHVSDNVVSTNTAFRIDGESNMLSNNVVTNPGGDFVYGVPRNSGFLVKSDHNVILRNRVSSYHAFIVHGSHNDLRDNLVVGAYSGFQIGDETGLKKVNSTRNSLLRNRAVRSAKGIVLHANTTQTFVTKNTAFSNDMDMSDLTDNCDSNTWRSNLFRTANGSCIE